MAIVSVKEISDGRGGEETYAKNKCIVKDTRVFRAITDSNYDSASDVLGNATIPILGQEHPKNSALCCNARRPKQDSKSKRIWTVTCDYTTDWSSSDGSGLKQDPTMDRALVEWATEVTQIPVFEDKDGNAILNSAGYYYINGLKAEDTTWVVTVTKNMASVPIWILNYRNAINSSGFLLDNVSIPARAAKIRQISIGHWQLRNKIWFKQLKLVLKLQDDWSKWVLDEGLYQIDPDDSTKRVPCVDSKNQKVRVPVPLDGSGVQLSNPSPSTAVFREHKIYPELSFSSLPLI